MDGTIFSEVDFSVTSLSLEQIVMLGRYLRERNQYIKPVARDGLCILNSFMFGFKALSLDV